MKLVYIAHPLFGDGSEEWGNTQKNVERYLFFVAHATTLGHAVISWVHHYLTHTRGLTEGDADFYLSRDRVLLSKADELWVCGPPAVSSGTRYEIECASEFGIPIVRKAEWLDAGFRP